MTLADELLGIKPKKTLQGRVICNVDEDDVRYSTPRTRAFDNWIRGRTFLAREAADALGLDIKAAQFLIARGLKNGLLRKLARAHSGRIYCCASVRTTRAQMAAKVHFGA